MTTPTADPIVHEPLKLTDRCDRCGAQAFVRASILVSISRTLVDLLWCAHHFAKHESELRKKALTITDERHKINEKPSISANKV